jgi:polysaccharide biosynthesis transport protein
MDLNSLGKIIWRQRLVVAAVMLAGVVCFAFASSRSKIYSASATILAGTDSNNAALDPTKNPIESAISPSDLPTLLHSSTVMARVAAALHLSHQHARLLARGVKAKAVGADVLSITATDEDPDLAVAEANALARSLQHFEQQIEESRYDLLTTDLRLQLENQRVTLSQVDQHIAGLTSSDPYITDQDGTSAINTRLVALLTQRDTATAQMVGDAATALKESRRPGLARDLASEQIVQNDPVFQSLRTQFGKDLAQYNLEKAGYKSDFPGLVGMKDQIDRENGSLASATADATKNPSQSAAYVDAELDANKADAQYAGDRAQVSRLDGQIADLTSHLSASSGTSATLQQLHRERDAGNQVYAQLSARLAQAVADRSQAGSVNSIVIVDEAAGAAPTLLSRTPVILGATVAAFAWLAITLAFLLDRSDGRLRTRTTIEDLYGTRVLTNV